jgi:hypothetical protein
MISQSPGTARIFILGIFHTH